MSFFTSEEAGRCENCHFSWNPNPDDVQSGWIGHYGFRAAKPADWIAKNWRAD